MYVKKYDQDGKLLNPITKKQPFYNDAVKERKRKSRLRNKLVITRIGLSFYKTKVFLQRTLKGNTIEHSQLI